MLLRLLCIAALCLLLSGCGLPLDDLRSKASGTIADLMPTWMGGLPKEVPPRPGDPKYAEWLKAQQDEAARPKSTKKDEMPQQEDQISGGRKINTQ